MPFVGLFLDFTSYVCSMNGGISMPFLDTIEKGITKVRDLGELSRLNGEIAIRETHRKECFTVMGEKYYDSLKKGTIPDCTILYREIQNIEKELEHLKREIQKLRKIMICPKCGSRLTSFGAFCPVCGTELMKKNICSSCGAVMDPGANYCVNCGNRTLYTGIRGE